VEEVARVYARSLFEVAQEHGKLDVIRDQLRAFTDALSDNHELSVFFFTPYFSPSEKLAALRRALQGADPHFQNFLELLIESRRMPIVFRMRRDYEQLWNEANHRLAVQVTSAVELDPDTLDFLAGRIAESTGQQIDLTATVDPDVLGGLVLRVGNSILDASIAARLRRLRDELVSQYA
jgi:ATP synthase F1 delta subunit